MFEKKRNKKILFIILLLGFLIRIIYLYFFKDTVFFNPYLMDKFDQKTFILWAEEIIKHPFWVDGKIFYMAPFYPYFLSLIYLLTGKSLIGVLIFQIFLDVILCYLLFMLGKYIICEEAGLIAAFFGSFYKTFIVYSSTILSDSLILFLYTFFIFLVYFALQKENFLRWTFCGIVLGFSALAKPTIGIYLPFLLTGLFLYPENRLIPLNISRKKQVLIVFLILITVSGLTVLPVTLRNFYVGKVFVPICANGPENWRIGNSSDSIGLFYYPTGTLLSPLSLVFWKKILMKLNLFFISYEWPQNMNVYQMEEVIPFLKIAFLRFGFIVPVGMAGFFLLFKNFKKNFLFLSFTFTNVLWVVLFFITDRYRLPSVACFMVCASYVFIWTFEKLKRERKILSPFFLWLIIGLFAYFFDITPGEKIPDMNYKIFASLTTKNINHDLKKGNNLLAYKKAKTLLRILPDSHISHFLMGCVYSEMGKEEMAKQELKKSLEIKPDFELAKKFLKEISK